MRFTKNKNSSKLTVGGREGGGNLLSFFFVKIENYQLLSIIKIINLLMEGLKFHVHFKVHGMYMDGTHHCIKMSGNCFETIKDLRTSKAALLHS